MDALDYGGVFFHRLCLEFFPLHSGNFSRYCQPDRGQVRSGRSKIMNDTPPIRVLPADDHAVGRAGIRQFLETSNEIQVVAEVDDGDRAIQAIQEHQPDVAVLDIQMPGKSGIEVTRWVRTNARSTGVL